MVQSGHDVQQLLGGYLSADGKAAEAVLANLVEQIVDPAAAGIIARKLHVARSLSGSEDAIEIAGDVRVQMIGALRRLRSDASQSPIDSLEAYTAIVTRNAINEYLRKRFPARFRLSNQLRYLMSHGSEFRLWRDENGVSTCSLTAQAEDRSATLDNEVLIRRYSGTAGQRPLRALAADVLHMIGGAVAFDRFVAVIAEIRRIVEPSTVDVPPELPSNSNGAESITRQLDQTELLRAAWREIEAMPLRHRRALLLHFSDDTDDNLLMLFPLNGVASIRAIAEAVEIDLDGFAAMWNELPLADTRIAAIMGLERQQVINLRQSARNMLKRRLGHFARPASNFAGRFSSQT